MDTHTATPEPESAPIVALATRPPAERRRVKPLTIALGVVIALAVVAGGFVGIAKATDSPTFCGSACHEMSPYHTAWSSGAHKGIACVECHVDAGPAAEIAHKFVAMRQLVDHFKGAPSFPLATPVDVPDSRCIRCHQTVVVKLTGFSHADHAKRGPCIKCHADAGHNVTTVALKQAGIFNVDYQHAVEPTSSATPGGGKADIPGHVTVACSNCHDMAAMACSACHTPGPNHQGRPSDCSQCHAAGPKFVFVHPQRTDCQACHTPPADLKPPHPTTGACTTCHLSGPGVDWKFTHPQITTCGDCHQKPATHTWTDAVCTDCHQAGPGKSFAFTHPAQTDCSACHTPPASHNHSGACSMCHHNPGKSWTFAHPSSSANCVSCHAEPSNHGANRSECPQCHQTGVSWSFDHPGQGADCESCHARPSGHHSGTCATCHKNPGKSWTFSHPAAGATCASCHTRPSNHAAGACQNCHHNPGRNWAFSHPSSSECSSCHTPPSNHYGTNCASCHVAGTTWSNVHFDHPAIPNGSPHTYKTWPCAKCHPNGPPAYFCTCHGNTTGPND